MKRAKQQRSPELPNISNPVARSPHHGNGGAHGKTTAAKRRAAKIELARQARDPEAQE